MKKCEEDHDHSGFVNFMGGKGVVSLLAGTSLVMFGVPVFIPILMGSAGAMSLAGAAGVTAAGTAALFACVKKLNIPIDKINDAKIMTATNEAGQTLQGPFWAIRCLNSTQRVINNLTKNFNQAAAILPEVQKGIRKALDHTAEAQRHVTILVDGEPTEDKYRFVVRTKKGIEPLA